MEEHRHFLSKVWSCSTVRNATTSCCARGTEEQIDDLGRDLRLDVDSAGLLRDLMEVDIAAA